MNRLACLLAISITIPAFAQSERHIAAENSFASDFQTVPVMANVPGVGGTFQSYVALFNPTSSSFVVTVTLFDGAGVKRTATITLAAGELKTYTNFLDAVFQFSGGGAVTFQSPDSNKRFIVSTEVRTGGTRFNTTIPALEFAGSNSPSFSAGITVDASSRTNVGCFNQSSVPNAIKVIVFDNSGTQMVGTLNLNLAANAWGQAPVTAVVSGGYVRFEPTEAAVCYAVVVDNGTNDGRFISAAEYRP